MVFLDYYQILEIPRNATNVDIRQAYRRLALRWHPDKNLNIQDEATRKFKRISEAYQILGDAFRRRDHDYDLSKHPHWNTFTASPRPPTPHTARRSSTASAESSTTSDQESSDENNFNFQSSSNSQSQDTNSDSSSSSDSDSAPNFGSSHKPDSSPKFDSSYNFGAAPNFDSAPNFEYGSSHEQPPSSSSYNFRNPYEVFDEFFGSKVVSKFCPERERGFGFNLDQNYVETVENWPKPPTFYSENDKMRRRVVKKMTVIGLDGSTTTLETKIVTVRENGKEMETVSTCFEDGILRTTSIKPKIGSQITTFH